jgi:hypothetical protein
MADDNHNLDYICLHQMSKKTDYHIPIEGKGNCNICKPGDDNKKCIMYYPIRIRRFYVIDKNDDSGRTGTEEK